MGENISKLRIMLTLQLTKKKGVVNSLRPIKNQSAVSRGGELRGTSGEVWGPVVTKKISG